jgi:hypothetical protein
LQLAAALGAAEEYKRHQQQPTPIQQVQPQQPVQQQPMQPPPGYTMQPIPGYIPPGYAPPPGYQLIPVGQGVGAPEPPHQQQVVPPPPPPPAQVAPAQTRSNPLGIDLGAIMGAMQSIEQARKVLGINPNQQQQHEEEDEPSPIPGFAPNPVTPAEPPAVTSVPLGPDADSLVYVHNRDGTPNVMGLIMGNLPKLPGLLERAARAAGAVNQTVEHAARQRPIQANGYPVIEHPQQQPYPQQQQQRYMPPTPAQIVEEQRQPMSLIPNLPRQ